MTYILGIRSANKYTLLGSVLHEVFEQQGKQLIAKRPWTLEDLLKKFNKLYFDKEQVPTKYFIDKEDYIKMYKKGCEAIRNFFKDYHDLKPTFVEKKFEAKLVDDIPPVLGYIDRIDGDPEDASTWIVTDYKSGSSMKSKPFLTNDIQLAIYAQAIFKQFGAYPQAVCYYHPVLGKWQKAMHQGDGNYKYTNQRNPVVTFSVSDAMVKARSIVEKICESVRTDTWNKEIDGFGCKFCFHFKECKPFDGDTWDAIVN
ncbi:PD-(D/E)XK nuclease superfamily protein [Bacillus phage Anath]|uniref:PD-(D/E)XK nuclease superfamily protein n=1 Tax=Bacillus phage Anath TaxID=2108114 RepID=A0A2P1JUL9_9CAUD|nr:PD-(D/E)XK nuclease superfamily protein [Bacillus phage Anath]